MSNESSERRPREVATSTFEEWVAQKAADRDSSRERILKQLLDSYWTLEQIDQVLGGQGHAASPADDNQTGESPRPEDGAASGALPELDHNEILGTVETLQTELETASQRRAELVDQIETLADRLDEVEATQGAVDELAETIEQVKSTLETDQARLHERIDDEFDNLQTILDYLVQAGDERDTRIDEIRVQYGAEIRELRAERDQLRRLKEDAHELGTYEADCEQCGESVDIALLTSPDCPNCTRSLTGVERETNWFFLTSYTATTDTRTDTPQSGGDDSEPSHDERTSDQRDDEADATATEDDGQAEETDVTQAWSAGAETRSEETESSVESADDDADEGAGTPPDETEFQWLS